MKIIYQILLIGLFLTALLFPQEKIIVLSKKVGERVEKKDALKYHLFQSIGNFESAVIKQKDSSYFAEVEVWREGRIIDSSFSLTYGKIINMAKLIEYSDEVNKGNYDYLNNLDVHLFYADGTPVKYKLDPSAFIIPNYKKSKYYDTKHSEPLPFINDPDRIKFKPSIRWGAGIGILQYPGKVSGESEFKQKLGITHLNPKESSGMLPFLFIGFFEWKFIGLEFECGGNNMYSKINLGANYLFKDILNDFITPFAGLSISFLKYSRSYESGDSIKVTPGYKDLLLGVDIHNNTLGYNLTAGVALDSPSLGLGILLNAGYTLVSKKQGTGKADILVIDLSGFYFEAQLKICFGEY
jgi:hypothetical protein